MKINSYISQDLIGNEGDTECENVHFKMFKIKYYENHFKSKGLL